jgi:hypothetical protein
MSTNWKHDEPKADPNFKHEPFIKSEREVTIDRLCKAVMTATPEGRRQAEWNLVNYIEGTDA